MDNSLNNFYVYMYVRSRSRKYPAGSPYYIGKGRGQRAYSRRHSVHPPADKSNIIFLATGMSDVDAQQAEMLLIHQYGRIDQGTGCLRNHTDGGDGMSGHISTPAQLEALKYGHNFNNTPAVKVKAVATRRANGNYKPTSQFVFSNLGKTNTDAQKQAVIDWNNKRWSDPEEHSKASERNAGEHNPFYAKTHSEEFRQSMLGNTHGIGNKGNSGGVGNRTSFVKGMTPWNKGLKRA